MGGKMKVPIPLGGIAIRRHVDGLMSLQVDRLIRKSLEFAFSNYPFVTGYVKQHSQSMSEEVMRQHIDLYVNNYSLELGSSGKNAIHELFRVFDKTGQYAGTASLPANSFFPDTYS